MKKALVVTSLLLGVLIAMYPGASFAFLDKEQAHEKYLYPIVRVEAGRGSLGSGTVIYSGKMYVEIEEELDAEGDKQTIRTMVMGTKATTYVLTNYHVIRSSITVTEEWDSDKGENVKKERRAIVYVESFKYRNLSTPVGTLRVEADIVEYNEDGDMALLQLRSEDPYPNVADIYPVGKWGQLHLFDETVAVGCSLAFPPLPTYGIITRKGFQVDSLEFWMSSSQVIYGNSGGAMFTGKGELIGIPSRLAIVGWAVSVTHMGLFIPLDRIHEWLVDKQYEFIFDKEFSLKDSILPNPEIVPGPQYKGKKDLL